MRDFMKSAGDDVVKVLDQLCLDLQDSSADEDEDEDDEEVCSDTIHELISESRGANRESISCTVEYRDRQEKLIRDSEFSTAFSLKQRNALQQKMEKMQQKEEVKLMVAKEKQEKIAKDLRKRTAMISKECFEYEQEARRKEIELKKEHETAMKKLQQQIANTQDELSRVRRVHDQEDDTLNMTLAEAQRQERQREEEREKACVSQEEELREKDHLLKNLQNEKDQRMDECELWEENDRIIKEEEHEIAEMLRLREEAAKKLFKAASTIQCVARGCLARKEVTAKRSKKKKKGKKGAKGKKAA
jgi:hypothetical protein